MVYKTINQRGIKSVAEITKAALRVIGEKWNVYCSNIRRYTCACKAVLNAGRNSEEKYRQKQQKNFIAVHTDPAFGKVFAR